MVYLTANSVDADFGTNDIKIEAIAGMLSLNRKYLSRIFKNRYGISIQQYLVEKRLTEAQKFLNMGYSVEQSAKIFEHGLQRKAKRKYVGIHRLL